MMKKNIPLCICVLVLLLLLTYLVKRPCSNSYSSETVMALKSKYFTVDGQKSIAYDQNLPIIFIGGFPRSGTTLMRAMLDAHPDVRCGEETRLIPRLLSMRRAWLKSQKESKRLKEAGLTDGVINSALAAFMLEIIVKHGEPAQRLCNKDPFTLKSGYYLSNLFPKSKFLCMIRDGRAVVNSIITRQVTISGFNLSDPRSCLTKWSKATGEMYNQCLQIGAERCMPVYYEQLVLHPKIWLNKILGFLSIPWNVAVLHHQDFIEKPGGISLSKTEKSSDQVAKPINVDALTKWVGKFPQNVLNDMDVIAPMLQKLGYDPTANPPFYGNPDQIIKTDNQQNKINDKKGQ